MQNTSTNQLASSCLKKTARLAYFILLLLFAFSERANAQWTTPTINGSFDGAGVYPNSLVSDGRTWYVTWDNTNLYVFVQGAGVGNRVLMYFDTNPSVPVNGGATGSTVGIDFSNTNLVRLPFSAEAFVAMETGYRQLNTAFTGTSFSGPINVTAASGWAFGSSGGDFEIQIPWNAITNGAGRPAAFNWFGYITDNFSGGNYFSKVPTANPGGVLGTTLPNATNTAGYERYFKVTNTGNGTSTNPFSLDCYTFVRHTGVDATGFGSITVEDFTMNTAGRSIVRASDASSWTINGTLRINNGTVNFGTNTGSCTVNGDAVVGSSGTLTLSSHANALTLNRNFTMNGTFTPANSTVRFAGDGNTQVVGGSASSITFYDIVVSKPNSFSTLTLPTTIAYNNPLRFEHETLTLNRNFILDSGLVILSPQTGSGTFTRTISGNVTIGSAPSRIDPTPTVIRTNTLLVVSNLAGVTVDATVTGNVQAGASGAGAVALVLAGRDCNSSSSTRLTVNGDFTFTTRPIAWSGNGKELFPPSGPGAMIFNFAGDITLNAFCTFNGDRSGSGVPTINLTGTSKTMTIPPDVFLGAGASIGSTNAQADWTIASGASITIPSTGSLAINMGRTLTLDGTLTCANGAQLIGTATGPSSGNPTFAIGSSGVLRVADVDGLGNGALIGSPNDSATPANATLFFRQRAPALPLQLQNPTPTNWTLTSISSNGTVEYNGTGQTVTPRNGTNSYNNLTFSGSGGKTLGGDVDVANTLNLNGGIVATGSNEIRVNNGALAAVTRSAGHINGRLSRLVNTTSGNRLYPIGDATTYRQITLPTTTSSGSSLLRGEVIVGNANALAGVNSPLSAASALRYYQFTNEGSQAIDVSGANSVEVNSDDGVGALNPNNSLRLATRTTGNWDARALTSAPNTTSLPIQITASTFSPAVTVSSGGGNFFVSLGTTNLGDNPLPVELVSFTATSTAQGVKLAWETASERESNGFTILRRKQGENAWTEVASYQTHNDLRAQNSLNGASYSYTDNSLLEVGKSYEYQLRETSFDGQVVTLETLTLTIRFNASRGYELAQNYPNPFNPTTTIRYQIPTAETVSLKVYDVLGKEVATLVNGRQEAGSHWVSFNAMNLASGVYFYRLQAGAFVETKKMVLVK